MNDAKLMWQERMSKSDYIASVWVCRALSATKRTVLADASISLSLVKENDEARVILKGPGTKPHDELLASGYECVTIRLQPGVLLRGFSAQEFMNSSLMLQADATGLFWLDGAQLQFPDFNKAEELINQLHSLHYLSLATPIGRLSTRSYSRLIKRTTGLSPYQLHQLQRSHQALRLLKQGMPATEVVVELDFVDQPHLIHVSRQFLGHTPKQLLSVPQAP